VSNLAHALNFENPNVSVPTLPQPNAPLLGAPCLSTSGGILGAAPSVPQTNVWSQLGQLAAANGFTVNLP